MSAMPLPVAELEPQLPRDTPLLKAVQPEADTGKSEDRYSATGKWEDQFHGDLRGAIRSAPIWRVRQAQRCFRLIRPLLVRVRQDEGFFFAENDTLRLTGTGTSPEEAVTDFRMHLVHFQQYYMQIPSSEVVGEGKRLKQLFQSIFVEER